MFLSPLLSPSLIPSILQPRYPGTRNVWEVFRALMMSASLRVFPGRAHLEEQSCKEKPKLYFRGFDRECQQESQPVQARTRHSQEALESPLPREADPCFTGCWHSTLSKRLFHQKLSGLTPQKIKTSLQKHINPHLAPFTRRR